MYITCPAQLITFDPTAYNFFITEEADKAPYYAFFAIPFSVTLSQDQIFFSVRCYLSVTHIWCVHVTVWRKNCSSNGLFFQEMELNLTRSCSQDGGRCTCSKALVRLIELRDKNLFCDAVLRLEDGGVFRVHRVILSMCSEYFRFVY
jgi:hypothetical protein